MAVGGVGYRPTVNRRFLSDKLQTMFIPCAVGYGQLLIIVLVVILLFGGKKIPEVMRGLGRGVREFKDALNGEERNDDNPRKEE